MKSSQRLNGRGRMKRMTGILEKESCRVRVRVICPLTLPSGSVLYLSPEQSASRRPGLEPLLPPGMFRSIKALSFKAGEVLGVEALPKWTLKSLAVLDEKEPPLLQAEQPLRLTVPMDLSFLEQVAWQLVAAEGRLTITAYQKRCRSVGRRRLQKVIKGLVEKGLFLREGESHHRCYRFGMSPCK
jgi:hypothetical protein